VTALLHGLRVLVPVTEDRRALADLVVAHGATAVEVEFLTIAAARDAPALERATLAWCAGEYDWLAVTSRNAVIAMDEVARAHSLSLADSVVSSRVAAVGEATKGVCASVGLTVHLVPPIATAAGLVSAFPEGTGTVLAPRGDRASAVLVRGLALKGWTVSAVEAYRTIAGVGPSPAHVAALAAGDVDAVLLTSGSMASIFAKACQTVDPSTRMVAIGATTAFAARAAGLTVAAVAESPTYESLVAALARTTGRTAP